jgi:hypothetical protein
MMLHALRDTAHALQNTDGIIYCDKFGGIIHARQFNDILDSCHATRQQPVHVSIFRFPESLHPK